MKKENDVECSGVFRISVSESLYKSLNTWTSVPVLPALETRLQEYLFLLIELSETHCRRTT